MVKWVPLVLTFQLAACASDLSISLLSDEETVVFDRNLTRDLPPVADDLIRVVFQSQHDLVSLEQYDGSLHAWIGSCLVIRERRRRNLPTLTVAPVVDVGRIDQTNFYWIEIPQNFIPSQAFIIEYDRPDYATLSDGLTPIGWPIEYRTNGGLCATVTTGHGPLTLRSNTIELDALYDELNWAGLTIQ